MAATDAEQPAPRPLLGLLPRSAAPPRPAVRPLLLSTLVSVAALVALVAIGTVLDEEVLIPPLAASMALVAGATALPLAQPRSVVGGQLTSALVGFAVAGILGHGLWPAAIAGGLALGAMLALRVAHSPAAATAVLVGLAHHAIGTYLGLLALATVVLVAFGIVGARVRGERSPTYWW
jgi:CBS-domain-containing membrane protein